MNAFLTTKKKRKKKRNAGRSPARNCFVSRWLLLAVGIAALSVQSFVVRPHFHAVETASLSAGAEIQSKADSAHIQPALAAVSEEAGRDGFTHNKAPVDLDFSDCDLCKTAHQIVQYLKPAATTFSLSPARNEQPFEFSFASISGTRKSFSRQTRAPPHA